MKADQKAALEVVLRAAGVEHSHRVVMAADVDVPVCELCEAFKVLKPLLAEPADTREPDGWVHSWYNEDGELEGFTHQPDAGAAWIERNAYGGCVEPVYVGISAAPPQNGVSTE